MKGSTEEKAPGIFSRKSGGGKEKAYHHKEEKKRGAHNLPTEQKKE